ncbi:MAG: hypothetical protein KAH54_08705 [Candidatus Sabulitectum sp.]|nr:hypothetical protein [Candidatus Sabulitectum sp.]
MKFLFFLFALSVLAFAADDGCTSTSVCTTPQQGSDDIELTLINDWTLSGKALGVDIFEDGSTIYILGVNNVEGYIQAYDEAGGTLATMPLAAANGSCFGVAWNYDPVDDTYYTDDWADNVLYFTDDFGVTWSTEPNPAGGSGRGMDFDGADYWMTSGTGGGLWRFQPGVGQENIAIPEVSTQPSGLTVFPNGANLGIALAAYNDNNIYFYDWDGSTMSFLGSALCPATNAGSYGLGYCSINEHIYWAYREGADTYHLAEFSFNLASLEPSTWGSIKDSF